MADKITLTRGGLIAAAVFMVVVALAAGAALYLFTDAPLPLVMLIVCLSPAATVLLLYIGHLVRSCPERTAYLLPLRLAGLLSACMGLLVLLDFLLPISTYRTRVQAVIPNENDLTVVVGKYELSVRAAGNDWVYEGQPAELLITPLFQRIEEVRVGDSGRALLARLLRDKILMAVGGLALLLPLGMIRYRPRLNDDGHNLAAFVTFVAPSYIISLIAMGLWIKFLMVHVFHAIDKM